MRVRIKTWEQMEKEFGLDSFGAIDCLFSFTQGMEDEIPADRIIRVSSVENVWVWCGWEISPDMVVRDGLELFDAVEVHRCVRCMDAGLNEYVEIDDGDGDPLSEEVVGEPFWSVYLHCDPEKGEDRGLECVADCTTRAWADLVARGLQELLDQEVAEVLK